MTRTAILSLIAMAAPARVLTPEALERSQSVMRAMYTLDYDRAEELSKRMIAEAPDDPAGYANLARTYWNEQLAGERLLTIDRFAASGFFSESPRYRVKIDPAAEKRFREACEEAIARGKKRLDQNPNDLAARYWLGVAYQNLGSYDFSLRRRWWSSFQHGEKTLRLHREILRREPDFADALLAIGVSNYVAAVVPWQVKWLTTLLGYRGSRERGKQELEDVARRGVLARDDARTVLCLLYTRDKQHDKVLQKLAELLERYPENYFAHLEMGGVAMRLNRMGRAIEIYQEILARIEAGQHRYGRLERAVVYNRLGAAQREQGSLEAAADWFRKVLDTGTASPRSQAVARLELGKTLDLMGRRQEALQEYRAVTLAEDFAGSRHEAEELRSRRYQRRRD